MKKIFTNVVFFVLVFIAVSAAADIYYCYRLTHRDPEKKGWTCWCDFRVFWTAGHRLVNYAFPDLAARYPRDPQYQKGLAEYVGPDKDRVYDRSEPFYHFRYSPITAFFMIPFALVVYPANSLIAWFVALNAALAASLFLLVRRISSDFGLLPFGRSVILWAAFLASLRFYLMSLSVGQSDVVVALLLVLFLAFYVRGNEAASGAIFALIIQFKPFFLPTALYFLLIGKRKLVFAAFLGSLALFIAPALVIGPGKTAALMKGWVGIMTMSVPSQILNYKNQSMVYFISKPLMGIGALKASVAVDRLFYILSAALTVCAYAALIFFGKARKTSDDKAFRYLEVSLLIVITLLFSPLVWVAHFIYLIIPAAVATLFAMKSRKRAAIFAALAGFAALSLVAGTDMTNFIPGMRGAYFANIALGALFLAYALVGSYAETKRLF